MSVLLRLFAPFLPYVTEEVWSWWQNGSIHRAWWPKAGELPTEGDPSVLQAAADILAEVRKAKTEAKQSLRADVARVVVRDAAERIAALRAADPDVKEAGHITELAFVIDGGDFLAEREIRGLRVPKKRRALPGKEQRKTEITTSRASKRPLAHPGTNRASAFFAARISIWPQAPIFASVPIPKFATSRYRLLANFGIERTLATY